MIKHRLTNAQKLIVRMEESYKDTAICTNCYEVKFDYPLSDVEKAIEKCMEDNPILSSRIVKEDNEYYCLLDENNQKNKDIKIPIIKDGFDDFIKEPINIFDGEHIKFAGTYKNGELYVYGKTHHLFFDAASGYYMMKHIRQYLDGEDDELKGVGYLTYIDEEDQYSNSKAFDDDKNFWEEVFDKKIGGLSLSNKEARLVDIEAIRREYPVDKATMRAIDKIKNEIKCSTFDIFSGVLSLLLGFANHKAERVCFGTTFNNRGRKYKDTLGMFVNVLNFVTDIDYSMSAQDYLREVHRLKLRYFKHGKYPYSLVSNYSQEKHKTNKMYKVMLSYQPPQITQADDYKWHFNGYVESDCNMHVIDSAEEINILYDYKKVLFAQHDIDCIHKEICNIIKDMAANLNKSIGEVQICSKEDYKQVMEEFNKDIESKSDVTIVEKVRSIAEKYPDRLAVVHKDNRLTYSQLIDEAEKLAIKMLNAGLEENDIVGIWVERGEKVMVAIMATLLCKATYVPIDKQYPDNRIQHIIHNSKIRFLLVDEEGKLAEDLTEIMIDGQEASVGNKQLPDSYNPEAISYILYTSGSTGKPKGVRIKNSNIINLIKAFEKEIYSSLPQGIVVGLTASFSFDASVQQIYAALLLGNTLHIIPEENKRNGIDYLNYVAESDIDVLDMTPSHLRMLIDGNIHGKTNFGPKYILVGGEALRRETVKDFYDMFTVNPPIMYNVYGPTECCVDSTFYRVNREETAKSEIVPIGKPILNMKAYILNDSLKMLPIGSEGELYLSGLGVGDGYDNLEEETNKRFIKDTFTKGYTMYRTGDLARFLETGDIEYVDRIDNQVKVHGYRIELDEIENVLYAHENVVQAVVMVIGKADNKEIVSFVVLNKQLDEDDIKAFISKSLPKYMIPSQINIVDSIPLNQSGKIDKSWLLEYGNTGGEKSIVAPENQEEEKLLEIWKKVLGREDFGVTDDFFALGGHSLTMTAMMAEVEKIFGFHPSWNLFYHDATVRSVAKVISEKQVMGSEIGMPALKKAEVLPFYEVSSTQKRMFLTQIMNKDDLSNNSPIIMHLSGDVDIDRLKGTLIKLVGRHESLRTVFEMEQGRIVQKILPEVNVDVEVIKGLSSLNQLLEETIKSFDLYTGPLVRVFIAEAGEGDSYMVIDMHHIITDGESYKIIIQELSDMYNGKSLAANTYQYKDFSEWQKNILRKSDFYKNQEQYWNKQFATGIPTAKLSYDYPPNEKLTSQGKTINRQMSSAIYSQLKSLAVKNGVTVFMLLFALYGITVRNLTQNDEFVIPIPVADRTVFEARKIVGYFINMLPVKFNFYSETFSRYLQELKKTIVEAYDNQDYLFEDLVDDTDKMKEIMRVGFTETKNLEPIKFCGVDAVIVNPEYPISKYDLLMNILESEAGITISLTYRTQLFMDKTAETLMEKYMDCVEKVIGNTQIRIDELAGNHTVTEKLFVF